MWRVRSKVKRFYNNLLKLIVVISALIVAITLFNRHSTTPPIRIIMPDLTLVSDMIDPLLSWVKDWGGLIITASVMIIFLVKYIPYSRKVKKLKRSGIHDIDIMTGDQFEEFLVVLFRLQGFNAKKTKRTRDQGADVILKIEGR